MKWRGIQVCDEACKFLDPHHKHDTCLLKYANTNFRNKLLSRWSSSIIFFSLLISTHGNWKCGGNARHSYVAPAVGRAS
jgi:hypothetical protein